MVQFPEDSSFVRTDFYGTLENLGMYWDRPTIQAFHSIVPVSLMEFYPEVGVTRDVSSKPDTKLYALRSLLSVRWLVTVSYTHLDTLMEGRTVFVIAHRLSTVRNSNVILVPEHGKIIEEGNHDELIAQKGKYYQLYTGMFELS